MPTFGQDLAEFVDLSFKSLASEYNAANWQWATYAKKRLASRRTLREVRTGGRDPKVRLSPRRQQLCELLFDLDGARRRLDWLTSRTDEDVSSWEIIDRGEFARWAHDSVFIYGAALVGKTDTVISTMINLFTHPGGRTKREVKQEYVDRLKQQEKGIGKNRDPMLHGIGRGGKDRPETDVFTNQGWWEWMLALDVFPPKYGHQLVLEMSGNSVTEWLAKLRPAAEGTADFVGDTAMRFAIEYGLAK